MKLKRTEAGKFYLSEIEYTITITYSCKYVPHAIENVFPSEA